MDLSIIIVSWKVKDKLRDNLKAIYSSDLGGIEFEIFVVDNNSGDQTIEMVRNDFPEVRIIANKENLGFARANNQATQESEGRFILLLNPDMKVEKDTIKKMLVWMNENPTAKVASCKLVNQNNDIIKHVRKFPTFWNQLAIVLKLPHVFPWLLNNYIIKNFDYNKAQKVDSVRGSFFMMRRFGKPEPLLDERYFIWFEEVDYCKQVYKNGGEVWYAPVGKCTDYIGASFNKANFIKKQMYVKDSMLKYFKKWHSGISVLFLRIAWFVILIPIKLFYEKNRNHSNKL